MSGRSRHLTAPFFNATIHVGNESNVQDHVELSALNGGITIGRRAILAHGATVKGPAQVGQTGTCPVRTTSICPSFAGFNVVIAGAVVQKDAKASAPARVGPGVTIPSGRKVPSGANVTSSVEVAAGENPRAEGMPKRELMLAMQASVQIRAVFAGGRRSAWSGVQSVGEVKVARALVR